MGQSLFFKNKLILGNPKSNVVICTLWLKKEELARRLRKENYRMIGNLYTIDGISYLIKNILANPSVKYIIVCGKDLTGSGDALIKLFKNGIDSNGKIIGTNAWIHPNIRKELIEILRKNIKVIDLRGKEKEVPKVLKRIGGTGRLFMKPIILKDVGGIKTTEINTEIYGFRVEGRLDEVWLRILDLISKFGEVKESQHGLKQKEILDVLSIIRGEIKIKSFFGFDSKLAKRYINSFFSKKKPQGIEYTYGERLFKYTFKWLSKKFKSELTFFINQIDEIVKMLKSFPYSRRAVVSLWDPFSDLKSANPPCLTQITWNIKNSKLHQTCVFRSHDIFGAYPLNAIALKELQKKIAKKIGSKVGDLIILSQSAHIYENCWKKVEEILNKFYRCRLINLKSDPAGYFRIWIDWKRKEIIAQHYLNDGRKTHFQFRGRDAQEIYRRILNENLVTRIDHAAYLGKELQKAKECLENRRKYEQDMN